MRPSLKVSGGDAVEYVLGEGGGGAHGVHIWWMGAQITMDEQHKNGI